MCKVRKGRVKGYRLPDGSEVAGEYYFNSFVTGNKHKLLHEIVLDTLSKYEVEVKKDLC